MDKSDQSLDQHFSWIRGEAYERYVGRWSSLVAQKFLAWLSLPSGLSWLDVGCGTGALCQGILQHTSPCEVTGIDPSEGYLTFTRQKIQDGRARFKVADARAIPLGTGTCEVVVSGFVLNFIPQPELAAREMARVVKPGGVIAAYVWDYAGKMQMMRHFWNTAAALDPAAYALDEGRRFPLCNPGALVDLFRSTGLQEVETLPLDIDTDFRDFEDYWSPFLGGQGPAPGYAMSLSEESRAALRERIRDSLPFALDGSIPLVARAWAVKGRSVFGE
jgi:SAM-dependent methyltransferase